MANEEFRRIRLEYPDFTYHDVMVTGLSYNIEKDIYLMSYYDFTLESYMDTILSRANCRLFRNPFIENDQIEELKQSSVKMGLGVLRDEISCLKTPFKKSEDQCVVRFNVHCDDGSYYISQSLASKFGIDGSLIGKPGSGVVRVSNSDINRIINLTKNDQVRLEPIYTTLTKTQRVASFRVLSDDVNLFITKHLADQFGINNGFALRYDSLSWRKVTREQINEIIEKTKNSSICLQPEFEHITKEKTTKSGSNKKATPTQSMFLVLNDGDNLYIQKSFAKQFGIDHGFAFMKDGLEWTRISKSEVQRIEELTKNNIVSLKAQYRMIDIINNNLKPNTKAFSVVIDLLLDDNHSYIKKEVAKRFNLTGTVISYDSKEWVRVTKEQLDYITRNYMSRKKVQVEFNRIKMTKSNTLSNDEFEVLCYEKYQYISVDLLEKYNLKTDFVVDFNGKKYCKVSEDTVKKIMAFSFYSDVSLRPKNIMISKRDLQLTINYYTVDGLIFVPIDLLDLELDKMNGKMIRVNGKICISISEQKIDEIRHQLENEGYKVILNKRKVEKINQQEEYDNKKLTR